NYVAENPTTDSRGVVKFHDYTGGSYAYPWHEGIDFSFASFAPQDIGVPVFAAASGPVLAVHHGEVDRQARGKKQGNRDYIIIDHGNGWSTLYGHLRKDSLAVHAGDYVQAGETIGLVGSAGNSTGTHLHFNVQYQGMIVDPYSVWKRNPFTGSRYSAYWA